MRFQLMIPATLGGCRHTGCERNVHLDAEIRGIAILNPSAISAWHHQYKNSAAS